MVKCKLFVATESLLTDHWSLRYEKAQAILFGDGLEVASRFDVANDEKGQILLKKIFSVYQARVGMRVNNKT